MGIQELQEMVTNKKGNIYEREMEVRSKPSLEVEGFNLRSPIAESEGFVLVFRNYNRTALPAMQLSAK